MLLTGTPSPPTGAPGRRVGVRARPTKRLFGPVQLAQYIERGAPRARLLGAQASLDEATPAVLAETIAGVEQAGDQRVAMPRIEQLRLVRELLKPCQARTATPDLRLWLP